MVVEAAALVLRAVVDVRQQVAAEPPLEVAVAPLLEAAAHPRENPRQRKLEITVKFSIQFWIPWFNPLFNLWSTSHEKNLIPARFRLGFVFWRSACR
jgi:hypothetical protein